MNSDQSLRPCALCGAGADNWRTIVRVRHRAWPAPFDLFRCRCGLLFTSLAVDGSDLSLMYGDEYFNNIRFQPESYEVLANEDRALLDDIGPAAGRTLLDVGCGEGSFLALAAARGYAATGVDTSACAVRKCRERGLTAYQGDAAAAELGREQFDVVASLETVEHIKDPVAFLRALKARLRPDGTLLVKTILVDNIVHQILFAVLRASLGLVNICHILVVPHHTYYYRVDTFTRIAARAGLAVRGLRRSEVPAATISRNRLVRAGLQVCYALDRLLGQGYIVNYRLTHADKGSDD